MRTNIPLWMVSALLLVMAGVICDAEVTSVTISSPGNGEDPPTLALHEGIVDGWVAKQNFSDEIFENGWAYLELETNPNMTDQDQAYAAGFIEGAATADLIYNMWRNTLENYCEEQGQEYCDNLRDFLTQNNEFMKKNIDEFIDKFTIWYQVDLILHQLQGLTDGYNNVSSNPLKYEDILMMNLHGDLEDLERALKPNATSSKVPRDGSCSALVKLLPNNEELYCGHVTWTSLSRMLRVQKKYILPFKVLEGSFVTVAAVVSSFSSYPGYLFSGDDWYLLSSGLVTMETTIGNNNPALYDTLTPETILEWLRTLVANRLATIGEEWSKLFSNSNSGTYNNQWIIVDYKRFTPMEPIKLGVLTILEQVPILTDWEDESSFLELHKYWPSYNIPYFENVFNISGNQQLVDEYGDWYSYDKNPRAQIFARDEGSVVDMESMIKLMRYNDFQNDPLSVCDCDPPYSGENAISARNDLNPENMTYPFRALGPRAHDGTDMKVTSFEMFKDLEYIAISSPTYDQQPAFQWSTSQFANNTPHYGHPDLWNFSAVQRKWNW